MWVQGLISVAVVTPSYGGPTIEYTNSLVRMVQYWYHTAVFEGVPQKINYITRVGSGISSVRETLCRDFLEGDYTHLLFIDEDTGFEPQCLHYMLSRKLPIVGCNYRMRIPGGRFVAEGDGYIVQTKADSTGRRVRLHRVWVLPV